MKVTEGGLEYLQSMAEFLRTDKSQAAELIRGYVEGMVKDQALGADVLPNSVKMQPDVTSDKGKFAKFTA